MYSIKRNKEKRVNDKVEFELLENKICYSSSLNNWTKKWEYYDYYKITNNNLSLYLNSYNSSFPELVIPLTTLNLEQKELLNSYINKKIKNYTKRAIVH